MTTWRVRLCEWQMHMPHSRTEQKQMSDYNKWQPRVVLLIHWSRRARTHTLSSLTVYTLVITFLCWYYLTLFHQENKWTFNYNTHSEYNDWPLLRKEKIHTSWKEKKVPDMKKNTFIPQTLNILLVHLVKGNCMHALRYTTLLERGSAWTCMDGRCASLLFIWLPELVLNHKVQLLFQQQAHTVHLRPLWPLHREGGGSILATLWASALKKGRFWFGYCLCWVFLTGQPPQPGNRCVVRALGIHLRMETW